MINTFNRDLNKGHNVEKLVADFLRNDYPCISIITGNFKGYDIWIPELHKSIEVKSDFMSVDTGNIVIEIEMCQKPSGLTTTKADYWVFYDGIAFIYMTPQDIRNCILFNKLTYREFIGNGDTQKKKVFLINKKLLFSYGNDLSKFKEYNENIDKRLRG